MLFNLPVAISGIVRIMRFKNSGFLGSRFLGFGVGE